MDPSRFGRKMDTISPTLLSSNNNAKARIQPQEFTSSINTRSVIQGMNKLVGNGKIQPLSIILPSYKLEWSNNQALHVY